MVFPPGQGRSGQELMSIWRQYLEQYAQHEGNVEGQVLVGAYHAADILRFLSGTLDRDGKYRQLIEQRMEYFRKGSRRDASFEDRLATATLTLHNHLNTLSQQFASENPVASDLITQVCHQVEERTQTGDPIERASLAMRACFPLLSLMTLVLARGNSTTTAIRQVEQRFVSGDRRADSDWEHFVNALYRVVEMMQIFTTLSDGALSDQVQQIAARFQEEDQTPDLRRKLRNGFCRLFELTHLLTIHIDATLP